MGIPKVSGSPVGQPPDNWDVLGPGKATTQPSSTPVQTTDGVDAPAPAATGGVQVGDARAFIRDNYAKDNHGGTVVDARDPNAAKLLPLAVVTASLPQGSEVLKFSTPNGDFYGVIPPKVNEDTGDKTMKMIANNGNPLGEVSLGKKSPAFER